MIIDLNCDMGESFGSLKLGFDEEVIKFITSANIACGFHSGDPLWMEKTITLANKFNVSIGAHPSFPDLVGFGRRKMELSKEELKTALVYQVGALKGFLTTEKLQHIKPHGALYNMAVNDKEIASNITSVIKNYYPETILLCLSQSKWAEIAKEENIKVAEEVFAERQYNDDGSLVSRKEPEAVITNEEFILERTVKMIKEKKITSLQGNTIKINPDTVCLHGDTPGAVTLSKTLRYEMERSNITILPLKEFIN